MIVLYFLGYFYQNKQNGYAALNVEKRLCLFDFQLKTYKNGIINWVFF